MSDDLMSWLLMGSQVPNFERRMEAADTIARLQAELAEAQENIESAYAIGVRVTRGAMKDELSLVSRSHEPWISRSALQDVLDNIPTPSDVTQAAARVLLAMTDAGRDDEIGPWLRALAEGDEHE